MNEKHLVGLTVFVLMLVCLAGKASATLIVRGQGTSEHGTFNLVYDDDLNITWYDYSFTPTTWDTQMLIIAGDGTSTNPGLQVSFNGLNLAGWRLPSTDDIVLNGNTGGYNLDNSEMSHLYYSELDNLGYQDIYGTPAQPGWGLSNTYPFQNLDAFVYWSGTEVIVPPTNTAWVFHFDQGWQESGGKFNTLHALAVRDGDISPVPEPSTMFLFGAGIAGLAVTKIRRKRK